jgi:hypothetical protein
MRDFNRMSQTPPPTGICSTYYKNSIAVRDNVPLTQGACSFLYTKNNSIEFLFFAPDIW